MRITLNLDAELVRAVKRCAVETQQTIAQSIEDALRENLLMKELDARKSFKFRWITGRGKTQPDIDLTDRDALIDRMENLSDRN